MFPDIWYIDELPLDKCTTFTAHIEDQEWFIALKADIEKRGMLSPILVNNTEGRPYWIRHGNNRAQAARALSWGTVSALSFGIKPDEDLAPVKMESLTDAQSYLCDGIIGCNLMDRRDTFKIHSSMMPEKMKYPT